MQQPDFSRGKTYLEILALEQGVRPVIDFDELMGDFWPEEEDIEEFRGALQELRREGLLKRELSPFE
jgi:hypothetical protein